MVIYSSYSTDCIKLIIVVIVVYRYTQTHTGKLPEVTLMVIHHTDDKFK